MCTVRSLGSRSIRRLTTRLGGAVLAATMSAASVQAGTSVPPAYTLTDLGVLPGFTDRSWAQGMNDAGDVVGFSALGTTSHAFLFHNGAMTDLDASLPGQSTAVASGINDAGQISGSMTVGGATHAYLYSAGAFQDLGTFGGDSHGAAINSTGTVVGDSYKADRRPYAVAFSAGTIHDLGAGTSSIAEAVNASGEIAGVRNDSSGNRVGFTYSNGTIQNFVGLGVSGDVSGMNNNGDVVGSIPVGTETGSTPFLYSGGAVHDLGTGWGTAGYAISVNDSRQVVGNIAGASGIDEAFLDENNTMYDVTSLLTGAPGYRIIDAHAINNSGQIAANAITPGGQTHAVLLTPAIAAVPLPPAAWASLTVLPLLLGYRRVRAILR